MNTETRDAILMLLDSESQTKRGRALNDKEIACLFRTLRELEFALDL
jgi:hypothetical protein